MFKKMLPLLAVLLGIAASSSIAADYKLSSTSIANGSTEVGLSTTIKFSFTDPLYVIDDAEIVNESIFPFPANDIEITGFRYTDNNYSIEFDVVHEDDVTFYWVVFDVLFENGNTLAANSVLHYSTGSSISTKQVTGQVEAYNIQYKGAKPEFVHPFVGDRKIRRDRTSGTQSTIQSDYNLEKSLVFLSTTLIEELEEADLAAVAAVGHVDSEGNYTVQGVVPGNYYIYGILLDDDDFAYGFYDANNDQEEDLVEYTSDMTDFDAPFIMRGYSGVFQDPFTADEFYSEALELAKEAFSDAKLMQIAGTETIETRDDDGKMYNAGTAYIWTYTFYSTSTNSAVTVLTSPFYSFLFPVDAELYGTPMAQVMELGLSEFESQLAATRSYNSVGKTFIAGLPDDADVTVTYELSRATSKYSNILNVANTLYWDVYFEGTYFDFMGNGHYRDQLVLLDGTDGRVLHTATPTSIENPSNEIPSSVELSQNYPNPFNPTTQISFTLPQAMDIRLAIYDLLGREVAVLANGAYSAGSHSVNWNALDLSSGVYLYRLQAGAQTQMRKMTLMK